MFSACILILSGGNGYSYFPMATDTSAGKFWAAFQFVLICRNVGNNWRQKSLNAGGNVSVKVETNIMHFWVVGYGMQIKRSPLIIEHDVFLLLPAHSSLKRENEFIWMSYINIAMMFLHLYVLFRFQTTTIAIMKDNKTDNYISCY